MNMNICPECGTENEEQYKYCKNCGTTLIADNAPKAENECVSQPDITEIGNPDTASRPEEAGVYIAKANPDYSCIDGIPHEDIKIFIGKKANEIMPKFINMEITGSKNSWCWPPAILGFFLGPLGAAIWFFYRKMYKPAFIFTAIGAIISLITAILTLNTTNVYTDTIISAFTSGNFSDIMSQIENLSPTVLDTVASVIEDISTIATSIITGLFSCYWYKNHCISKIKGFRNMNPDNNYYKLGLMSLGGTSGGMLALGIAMFFGVDYIITFVTTLITALN